MFWSIHTNVVGLCECGFKKLFRESWVTAGLVEQLLLRLCVTWMHWHQTFTCKISRNVYFVWSHKFAL